MAGQGRWRHLLCAWCSFGVAGTLNRPLSRRAAWSRFGVRHLRPRKRGGEVPDSVTILPARRLLVRLHLPSGLTARRKPVSYGPTLAISSGLLGHLGT